MKNKVNKNDVFGLVKPLIDVHTMGISTVANLLEECGLKVIVADDEINNALLDLKKLNNYGRFRRWLEDNNINRLGFSYRLDPKDGCDLFMSLFDRLSADKLLAADGGSIKHLFFAGLPETCERIEIQTKGKVTTFPGNENPKETLLALNITEEILPSHFMDEHPYDLMRKEFARKLIESERWKATQPNDHSGYTGFGTDKDLFIDRLEYARERHTLPIIRTHSGPYLPDRMEALKEYNTWVKDLASSRLLDVLSIGSSQLTQSNFGENWDGLHNGGGIPVNSEIEYAAIRQNAQPMLVRTYSGTKNVPYLAEIHERSLNISWHALSFWWFNELDGRGPNSLIQNLREHFETVRFAAASKKPVEPNVPHHFSFRGADDITYILSAYLAAKACKIQGINTLILQNMLNTPKYLNGIIDLARSRALLKVLRTLADKNFQIVLQTRAGLDFFSTDLDEAKIQLAEVTCLMDDIEPQNQNSPEIVHVVNYSEAVCLATPPIIKDSIKITLSALENYRNARATGKIPDMTYEKEVSVLAENIYEECMESIKILEGAIPNLYSPEGFRKVFIEGFFPVPFLMDSEHKFPKATMWKTALKKEGVRVVDNQGNVIYTPTRYRKIIDNIT